MTLEQFYFIAEIIAALAIIVSLIYLAIQIKQSRIQSKKDAIDVITIRRSGILGILSENTELSYIIPKGLSSSSKLSENEYFRYHSYLYTLFVAIEMAFIKWSNKDLDDNIWKAWDEVIHWWLRFPSVQLWWSRNIIGGFTADFNNYVNDIISELTENPTSDFEKQIEFMKSAGKKPKKGKKK